MQAWCVHVGNAAPAAAEGRWWAIWRVSGVCWRDARADCLFRHRVRCNIAEECSHSDVCVAIRIPLRPQPQLDIAPWRLYLSCWSTIVISAIAVAMRSAIMNATIQYYCYRCATLHAYYYEYCTWKSKQLVTTTATTLSQCTAHFSTAANEVYIYIYICDVFAKTKNATRANARHVSQFARNTQHALWISMSRTARKHTQWYNCI